MCGQPTDFPAVAMPQEALAWRSAQRGGRRALIRKELVSPPRREKLKALCEGRKCPAATSFGGLGWAGLGGQPQAWGAVRARGLPNYWL